MRCCYQSRQTEFTHSDLTINSISTRYSFFQLFPWFVRFSSVISLYNLCLEPSDRSFSTDRFVCLQPQPMEHYPLLTTINNPTDSHIHTILSVAKLLFSGQGFLKRMEFLHFSSFFQENILTKPCSCVIILSASDTQSFATIKYLGV